MSLIKRSNSKNWYYSFQRNGKRYFGTTGTANKKVAVLVEQKKRDEVHRQTYLGAPAVITLSDALALFRKSREGTPNYKNVVTYENKLVGKKHHPQSGDVITVGKLVDGNTPIYEIKTKNIMNYVETRKREGVSNWTIRHELQTLNTATQYVKSLGYLVNELVQYPSRELKVRKGKIRFLTIDEEKRLLDELSPIREGRGLRSISERTAAKQQQLQDNYDLVVALLDTGMRYSELTHLSWSAVSLKYGTIQIYRQKVDSEDVFHMTDRLYQVMVRRNEMKRENARYVFESKDGGPRKYSSHAIQKAISRAGLNNEEVVKEKGDKVTLHTLRHTFASRLVQNGVGIMQISKLLGHSSVRTTEIYAHLSVQDVSKDAAKVLSSIALGVL
jgi:integrase